MKEEESLASLQAQEEGLAFSPRFGPSVLLPCITVDARTGEVLMLAYMNQEALETTLRTGRATFFSRSRQKLWVKGETSGCYLKVVELLVDCDQDAFLLRVLPVTRSGICHTGRSTCFYRRVVAEGSLRLEWCEDRSEETDKE
jgi:phosphoribosyl-AMP cyclohydrolase